MDILIEAPAPAGRSPISGLLLAIGLLLAGGAPVAAQAPAAEAPIGVTAAVNPAATGVRVDGSQNVLLVGGNVMFKERIETGPGGQVQLLFADQTAISVGPNARVTIDEFVYNPDSGQGRMAVSLARGTMRFVGGKISKNNEVAISTPSATMGIRGGSAIANHSESGNTQVVNVFGTTTVRTPNGATVTLSRPGFTAIVAAPQPAGSSQSGGSSQAGGASQTVTVRQATPTEIGQMKSSVENTPAQQQARQEAAQAAAPGATVQQARPATETQPSPAAASPAAQPTAPGATVQQARPATETQPSPAAASPAAQPTAQGSQPQTRTASGQASAPTGGGSGRAPSIETSMAASGIGAVNSNLSPGNIPQAPVTGTQTAGPPPSVAPAQPAAAAPPPVITSSTILNLGFTSSFTYSGTFDYGLFQQNTATPPIFDIEGTGTIGLSGGSVQNGVFRAGALRFFVPADAPGRFFPVSQGTPASPGGQFSGTAFLSAHQRFLYGNFSTSSGGRAFVMAGTPVSGAGLMSVGTTARSYKLFADPAIGGNVPFVPQMRDGTSFANPSVQDMYLLTPAASGQSGRGMQVSFGLEGQGATQRSLLVSSQLNVFTDSNGAEVLGGGMRGGMRVVATNTPDRVTSGIGTQADAANNNFFGTLDAGAPSHMVLTNTSFGTPTSAVEREAADAFRTTAAVSDQHYRFNSVAQLSSANVSRTALSGVTVLSLYTAALRENPSFQAQMISSASDFSQNAIRLDPGSNNVSAILTAPNTSGSETFRFAFGTRPSTMTGTTIVGDEADFGASGSTLATNGARGALFDRDRWNALETTADPTASGVLTTSGGVTTNNTLAGVITSTVVSPNLTNRAAAWQAYILPSTATGFNFSAWSSSVTFCQCGPDLQWGFWGGRLNFPTGYSRQDRYHLALWVGGTPATIGSIPGSGTATYTGNTVAVINDNGARYLAASNYTQTWNFGSDSGTATIANLDGRTYTAASLSAANRRDFSGALTGQASGTNGSTVNATGIGGNLRGSFFAGTTGTADNVRFAAGNFNVASGTYSATGIFLSKR